MKKYLIFLLIVIEIHANASTYPISPAPLRELIQKSDYIIKGYVADIKNEKEYSVAIIAVKESYQGNINVDTIRIRFEPNMICPSPDMYFKNTHILSFLKKDKNTKSQKPDNYFRAVALNYGAKTLDIKDIEIYRQRIVEFQQISKMTDKSKHFEATVECLVKCAEDPATRWEGTYELSPESDFMSSYSTTGTAIYGSILSDGQTQRLKTALLQGDQTDYTDFGLADLVYPGNEQEIDKFLIAKLKALPDNAYWYIDGYFNRLKHLNYSAEMETLLKDFDKIAYGHKDKENRRQAINKFLALIGE